MNKAIYFKTSLFDPSKEDENDINPIYGQSLLIWLRDKLGSELEFSEIGTEDWGWYCYINWKGRQYLIGSIAHFEEGDDPNMDTDWIFQVDKTRSFKEVIFGKEKMTKNDPCFLFFKKYFEEEPQIKDVEIG
ncbi:hypothetical protein NBRC116583_07930 [Arenicella sp. 4NH20-0111]|uniref:hypothetical protein n=1 Tax=Arenicella sp. 4NH20-0111 TaxID=3127648 RepID=UPI00310B0F31